ncbi:Nitrilotriacetate monooxygenase component B [Rhodovulum sp. PH10]|uniref:flavin reductase family protein n=1 Tax=Rhodovulum sp. PH10 TaxID=1187851 RepID=UPI00027C1D73|nr:flavin reductase family protein [Rhodovulum sp. PH10]EJW13635.1 Nitrilotriacetate monooxygenase component B [Rhodovulum sp. PH10]
MSETHFYEPSAGHRLSHDPFKAIVAPRPIGWISTLDANGVANLAPYSFFNAVCDNPPMIAFSSNTRKHSLTNAEATGEFVWNLATRPLAEAMNLSSAPVPAEVDEFALTGLKTAPCRLVRPPRVAASPAALECRLLQVVELIGRSGRSADHWLVIGEVIGVHIRPEFLRDGTYDTGAAHPIMRAGYRDEYVEATPETFFRMSRPK